MTYQLVLVLLSNVVEVDIGDRIVTSICKMKVKVFIEFNFKYLDFV